MTRLVGLIGPFAVPLVLLGEPLLAQTGTSPGPVPCSSQVVTFSTSSAASAGPGSLLCDADGLIVHQGSAEHPLGDGGDTAQREGWYWLGVWIRQHTAGLQPWPYKRKLTFDQVLRLLEPNQDGVFYRHPKLAPWNNPYDKKFGFSRDQMIPLVAAMGVWGKTAELQRLWDALPEDALGKHSFNGNWRNLLGQDGWNCTEVKNRRCDATRDCTLKVDTRDCSLQVDTRDCTLQEDTRSCSVCLLYRPGWPFGDGGCALTGNDPFCEAAKATQNAIYKANKDACEIAKATQNAIYAGDKVACEAAKATQNGIYKAEKDACEVIKAGEKLTCEAQKTADLNLCRLSNVHSGDFIGPATENLFSRARNESLSDWKGEAELLANALLRVHLATDRDDTGDDLNLIVMLVMSALRSPTAMSRDAIDTYASLRPYSYGSYLDTYRTVYPGDATDMTARIDAGIRAGWPADKPPANGAVHWYHRLESGGNPELAELFDPIINRYFYGAPNGILSTSAVPQPAPTVSGVSPLAGPSDGGTLITVKGTGFRAGTTVLVGGNPATAVSVIDATTLTATTPGGTDGAVDISVTVPFPDGGTAVLPAGFTYRSTPPETLDAMPFGSLDTPVGDQAGVSGAIPFTGWALDDGGTVRVTICRDGVRGEAVAGNPLCGGAAQVYVGDGVFIEGARPDVQSLFPWYPGNQRAGWGFMVLTNMLPNRGDGTYTFAVYAHDREGRSALLGRRSLTCDNTNATMPFGTIDTPAQGETISGEAYVNFGWVLAPHPKSVSQDGSTITVYVDGRAMGHPSYGHARADIDTLFPDFANTYGAVGYYTLDTTQLKDGLHSIAWTVTDSSGVTSGIGSRFFRVANTPRLTASRELRVTAAAPQSTDPADAPLDTSPVAARVGWDDNQPWTLRNPARSGRLTIRGDEADRFELNLGWQPGLTYAGFMRVDAALEDLPAGSSLDAATGAFVWSPAAGYVGAYDLVFVTRLQGQIVSRREVRIIVRPKGR